MRAAFTLFLACILISGCQSSDHNSNRPSKSTQSEIDHPEKVDANDVEQGQASSSAAKTLDNQTKPMTNTEDSALCNMTSQQYESSHPEAISIAENVEQPVLVKKVEPRLDHLNKIKVKYGVTILMAVITENGTVKDPCLIRANNPHFDRAVLEAVRQWKYQPATKAGKPVAVFFTVTSRPYF